jgi:hypothetical protein
LRLTTARTISRQSIRFSTRSPLATGRTKSARAAVQRPCPMARRRSCVITRECSASSGCSHRRPHIRTSKASKRQPPP